MAAVRNAQSIPGGVGNFIGTNCKPRKGYHDDTKIFNELNCLTLPKINFLVALSAIRKSDFQKMAYYRGVWPKKVVSVLKQTHSFVHSAVWPIAYSPVYVLAYYRFTEAIKQVEKKARKLCPFIIFRHIYNVVGKSSFQRERFLPDVCQLVMSDVGLIGHCLTLKFLSPNFKSFAVECDWNIKISQIVRNSGFLRK